MRSPVRWIRFIRIPAARKRSEVCAVRQWVLGLFTGLTCGLLVLATPSAGQQQQPLVIKPLADKKVLVLLDGPLFWRIENFPTLEQAKAVAGQWGLVAESGGKVWLFRLGPASGASPGGSEVAVVGPVSRVTAPEYLLRINEATGPVGAVTAVHSHPGSEAFLVLSGEQCVRTARGLKRIGAGRSQPGEGANTPIQVSSCGSTDLQALVMFVVDASRPFSSPAVFQ